MQDAFRGQVYHSSEYRSGKDFKGKKAIVVGACNSGANKNSTMPSLFKLSRKGHDIAADFYRNGADVTMHVDYSLCRKI